MKVIDMHCDTMHELWEERKRGEHMTLRRNNLMLDLERMKKGGYSVQNFALFVEQKPQTSSFATVKELLSVFREEMEANGDWISQVVTTKDILENEKAGRLSALLTVEGGEACEGKPENLRYLYDQGVRMMTLTWNFPNEIGYPNLDGNKDFYTPNTSDGLTETGIWFVEEMEEMGMIVDVSHLSDAGFYDVVKHTRKPFVASHSNARGVCPWVRNLTDDMIRRLADRGGVMGLNYCADFLRDSVTGELDIGKHARYIADVGGIECVGLGSDFDGIPPYQGCPKVEKMDELAVIFEKNGFSQQEIDKIMYQNVFRVYKEILG